MSFGADRINISDQTEKSNPRVDGNPVRVRGSATNVVALEVACVDDRAQSGRCFILVPVVAVGERSGEKIVSQMARAIAKWVR